MIDNIVDRNQAPDDLSAGGGIGVQSSTGLILVNNRIEGNRAGGLNLTAVGGGIAISNSEVRIVGGVIAGNELGSTGSGAGVYAFNSQVVLEGVLISDNAAAWWRLRGGRRASEGATPPLPAVLAHGRGGNRTATPPRSGLTTDGHHHFLLRTTDPRHPRRVATHAVHDHSRRPPGVESSLSGGGRGQHYFFMSTRRGQLRLDAQPWVTLASYECST